jgi:hypothetical protein
MFGCGCLGADFFPRAFFLPCFFAHTEAAGAAEAGRGWPPRARAAITESNNVFTNVLIDKQ